MPSSTTSIQASPTMPDCLLGLQRVYIWQSYSLCLNLTAHTPSYSVFKLLYVLNIIALLFVAHKASVIDFGKNALGILNGIRLSSNSESILFVLCGLL